MAEAQPGDLIAGTLQPQPGADHIAIYIGDGKMIEAPRPGLDVRIVDVYEHARPRSAGSSRDAGGRRRPAAGGAGQRHGVAGRRTPYADLFDQAAAAKYGVDADAARRRRHARSPASTRRPSAPPAPRA